METLAHRSSSLTTTIGPDCFARLVCVMSASVFMCIHCEYCVIACPSQSITLAEYRAIRAFPMHLNALHNILHNQVA
jgi:ferredoxin